MSGEMLVHLEHCHLVRAEDFRELVVRQDLAAVLRVLQVVRADVLPDFAHHLAPGEGVSWLARQLTAAGVGFTLADNAFLRIDDWERAQALADTLSPDHLHRILDHYAQQCCLRWTPFVRQPEPLLKV